MGGGWWGSRGGGWGSSGGILGVRGDMLPKLWLLHFFFFFFFFFYKFLLDQGPVCGATDCSCFGLRVSFLSGFKSGVDLSPALFLACVR